MGDDVIQGVIETVDAAINYRIQLSQLVDSLHESKNQVITSASQARSKLRSHFDHLKLCIIEALDDRFRVLDQHVSSAEQSALKPLCQCEDLLQERVNVASGVLKEGKALLEAEDTGHGSKTKEMAEFKTKFKELDLNSLPEVPTIWDTACINVDLPRDEENIQNQLVEAIKDYGRVVARAPVQIVEILERPAALLVKWAEASQTEEHSLDLDVFRLQYCVGTVHGFGDHEDIEFIEAYEGPANSHVVRHLQPGIHYSFRVAGRAEGALSWSPWSIPLSAVSTLKHHEWRPGTDGYGLVNENMTAISEREPTGILYSRLSSYVCGHSIMIKVCGVGKKLASEGFGLSINDTSKANPLQKGMLFVSCAGSVFVDGAEKTTKLPPVAENSVVTFDTEVLQSDKVRVTIEVCERIVTFDWTLDKSSTGSLLSSAVPDKGKETRLYFLAKFTSPGWNVSVE